MCTGRHATHTEGLGAAQMFSICGFLRLVSQLGQVLVSRLICEQESVAGVYVTASTLYEWHWPIPRRGSAAARLLGLMVRIPPVGMDVCLL